MSEDSKSWPARHFSLSNAAGPGQDDVPALLRRAADAIERHGSIEIQDLVFHSEITSDGEDWPSVTIYFTEDEAKEGTDERRP